MSEPRLAFKLENVAGYSSNQVLKILKTGITLQPVLDEIYPIPESHVRGDDVAVRLVYQNMKYSDSAGNEISIDSLKVGVASSNETIGVELVGTDSFEQTMANVRNLNRLEASATLNNWPEGRYNVTAKAHDSYNTESWARYSFVMDRTGPTVDISAVGAVAPTADMSTKEITYMMTDTYSDQSYTVSRQLIASGDVVVTSNVMATANNGQHAWVLPMSVLIDLSDGVYTVRVAASDKAGNRSTSDATFRVDRAPPIVTGVTGLKSVYVARDRQIQASFVFDEAVFGMASLAWVGPLGASIAVTENPVAGMPLQSTRNAQGQHAVQVAMGVDWAGFPDGRYQLRLMMTDGVGNQAVVTRDMLVDRTPPSILGMTVDPMVISAKGPQMLKVAVQLSTFEDMEKWEARIVDGGGIERAIALSDTTLVSSSEGGMGVIFTLDATALPKGPGSIRFEVKDRNGNVSETRMPVIKDGMSPVIAHPRSQDSVDTVIAISGHVMDPDFMNTQPMQKYKLLYKRGAHTVSAPADVADFLSNPETLWVPARHRKGGGNLLANEGNVELRAQDILGYL